MRLVLPKTERQFLKQVRKRREKEREKHCHVTQSIWVEFVYRNCMIFIVSAKIWNSCLLTQTHRAEQGNRSGLLIMCRQSSMRARGVHVCNLLCRQLFYAFFPAYSLPLAIPIPHHSLFCHTAHSHWSYLPVCRGFGRGFTMTFVYCTILEQDHNFNFSIQWFVQSMRKMNQI